MLSRSIGGILFLLLAACGGGGGDGNGGGPQEPPDVTLSASPDTVFAGSSTTLTWSSSPGTTSCSASGGWSGALSTSGSVASPQIFAATTFNVRCLNEAGGTTASTLVNVRPPEFTLTVTPEVVERGGLVTLRWETQGMDACHAQWGAPRERPPNGSEEVPMSRFHEDIVRYNFIMQCDGGGQSIERIAPIRVKTFKGSVLFPRSVFVESDVNDPNANLFPNDTLDTPDPLIPLMTTLGYLNLPGEGPPGRSFAAGDTADFYRTDVFMPGELSGVRLTILGVDMNKPVGQRVDADLYLYDFFGNLLDASVGSGPIEALDLSAGGDFYFEVRAVTGSISYMLELLYPPAVPGVHGRRVNARFLPDEALVVAEGVGRGALSPKAGADLALQRLGLARKAGSGGREMRVGLPADRGAALRRFSPMLSLESPAGTRMTGSQRRKLATLLDVKALEAAPGIRAASTNRIVDAWATVPDDPLYVRQRWHYEMMSLPEAWDVTTGAPGVTVAVVDTGVARGHPDLQARLVPGYDMVSDPLNSDGDGLDEDYDDAGYLASGPWIFHGTHVAGTIGALSDNGVGVSGVTWSSGVMPIRALDGASGTFYDILQGVRFAAGLPNDSGTVPADPADIINLSLGASGDCEAVEALTFAEVEAAGVIVVASAGNNRANTPSTPASCPGVLSVASVGATGELAYYSNYGPHVDLAAPGGDMRFDGDGDGEPDGVFSTHAAWLGNSRTYLYEWLQGTSMAAPQVAGVLALMKSVNPALGPQEVHQLLAAGEMTDDVLAPGRDDAGHGIINALKSVRAATGDFDETPRLVASPSVLAFQSDNAFGGLVLSNGGGGVLTVTAIEPSGDWIAVTPADVDANGLGLYTIVVDGSGIPFGGQISGTLAIHTSAGTRHVSVVISNGYGFAATSQPLYVIVTDVATGEVVRRVRASTAPPVNRFRIDDLPPGRYTVVAGTDIDNDGNVCNVGEVCGAHPFYGLPEVVEYVDTTEGIDLPLLVTAKQIQVPP
jgi:serine protease